MWIYIRTESNPDLFTVGFYDPSGKFHGDSDHGNREDAAKRVHWLNGGTKEQDANADVDSDTASDRG